MIKIKATEGAEYLSEFMDELPRGIINKAATGCGGTTLALTSPKAYILAVPTVNLIVNKQATTPDLLGVYGGVTDSEIKDYLETHKVPKIMTTYDSLPRVAEFVDINDFRVLVDEFHLLLQAYGYRSEAIRSLLDLLESHPWTSYISATPIPLELLPSQLRSLPRYSVEWKNTINIKVLRRKTGSPYSAVVNLINDFKKGNKPTIIKDGQRIQSEASYFFINSVRGIKAIIDKAQLKPEEVRILCADNVRNLGTLKNFTISKASEMTAEDERPFNFITRASFEGCDFFSNSGICYIVTDCKNGATMYDVASDIIQIAGRIRTTSNPFKSQIVHLFNTTLAEFTPEEFKAFIQERKQEAKEEIANVEASPYKERASLNLKERIKKDTDAKLFICPDGEGFKYDELKENLNRYTYEVVRGIYTNGITLRESYLSAGFDVTQPQEFYLCKDIIQASKASDSWEELLKDYVELMNRPDEFRNFYKLNEITLKEPSIPETYKLLGPAKILALGYKKHRIDPEILTVKSSQTIREALKDKLTVGNVYSKKELKQILQEIYKDLAINKTAKASDISGYVKTKRFRANGADDILIESI
jgi:hypothetical protein